MKWKKVSHSNRTKIEWDDPYSCIAVVDRRMDGNTK